MYVITRALIFKTIYSDVGALVRRHKFLHGVLPLHNRRISYENFL